MPLKSITRPSRPVPGYSTLELHVSTITKQSTTPNLLCKPISAWALNSSLPPAASQTTSPFPTTKSPPYQTTSTPTSQVYHTTMPMTKQPTPAPTAASTTVLAAASPMCPPTAQNCSPS